MRGQGLRVFSLGLSEMGLRRWSRRSTWRKKRSVLVGVNDVAEAQALADVFAQSGCDVAVLDALAEAQEADLVGEGRGNAAP